MKRICSFMLLLALSASLALSSCTRETEPRRQSFYDCFDTAITVIDYSGEGEESFSAMCADVRRQYEEYHKLYDIYNEYDGINNLATLNRLAGEWVELDSRAIDLLLYGKEAYALTGGAVNIAMGSVLSLWHECRSAAKENPAAATLPSEAALSTAAKHCDITRLEIDKANSRARLADEGMRVDVGAVAKGYATEKIAERLAAEGRGGVVINAGGNVRIVGTKPSGDGFTVGIENPDLGEGGYAFVMTLSDTAVVTSGSYQRYFTVDGKRYGHIIDGQTLMPAEKFASVSVTVADSALADVLSTALFVMDYEEGRALIESLDGADAYWVLPDGSKRTTAEQ